MKTARKIDNIKALFNLIPMGKTRKNADYYPFTPLHLLYQILQEIAPTRYRNFRLFFTTYPSCSQFVYILFTNAHVFSNIFLLLLHCFYIKLTCGIILCGYIVGYFSHNLRLLINQQKIHNREYISLYYVNKCLRHLNSPSPSFMRGIRGLFLCNFDS